MPHTYTHQPHERVVVESDLPQSISQLIDDVSINGAVLVIRKNRPSIRIVPESEIDPELEKTLAQEAEAVLRNPDILWFESAEALAADLEERDAT